MCLPVTVPVGMHVTHSPLLCSIGQVYKLVRKLSQPPRNAEENKNGLKNNEAAESETLSTRNAFCFNR